MLQLPLVSITGSEKRKQNYVSWAHININIHAVFFWLIINPLSQQLHFQRMFNMHVFVDTWLLLPLIHTLSMFAFWIQHPVPGGTVKIQTQAFSTHRLMWPLQTWLISYSIISLIHSLSIDQVSLMQRMLSIRCLRNWRTDKMMVSKLICLCIDGGFKVKCGCYLDLVCEVLSCSWLRSYSWLDLCWPLWCVD